MRSIINLAIFTVVFMAYLIINDVRHVQVQGMEMPQTGLPVIEVVKKAPKIDYVYDGDRYVTVPTSITVAMVRESPEERKPAYEFTNRDQYVMPYDISTGMVPDGCSSWMSWMPGDIFERYGSTGTRQYQLQQDPNMYTDENGLQRVDDMYVVAVGTAYANTVGDILQITLHNGNVFYAVVGDFKADVHTDPTNRYNPSSMSVLEFLVDTDHLNPSVRRSGTVSTLPYFNSTVNSIDLIGHYNYEEAIINGQNV